MNEIGANPDDWDVHFLLTADINLADYTGTQFNIIGYYESDGSPNNLPFTGVFDGNSRAISNFTYECSNTSGIGLFGYINDPNAKIKDLTLISPNVKAAGNSYRVGSLVGRLENGTISDCGVEDCNVSGDDFTGGLVGENSVTVLASFWDIETTGQSSSNGGGTPKTATEMKRQSTFTEAGWDFIEIWNIGENQTYPFLRIHSAGDINHDDVVNFYDFTILADHWLQSTE